MLMVELGSNYQICNAMDASKLHSSSSSGGERRELTSRSSMVESDKIRLAPWGKGR